MEKLVKFQGHNITYPVALPIVHNGVSWSRSRKGKDVVAIKLELTAINKVFISIALSWWKTSPPPNFTKLLYVHKAFALLSPWRQWPHLAYTTKYMEMVSITLDNSTNIQSTSSYPLNSQHITTWHVRPIMLTNELISPTYNLSMNTKWNIVWKWNQLAYKWIQ